MKIKISKDIYETLELFAKDSIDANKLLTTILVSFYFEPKESDEVRSVIDQAEKRLGFNWDLHDRSKTIHIKKAIYKRLKTVSIDSMSMTVCVLLSKAFFMQYMNDEEIDIIHRLYEKTCKDRELIKS